MENYDIRAEARQLLKGLPGKYALFALPICYQVFSLIFRLKEDLNELQNLDSSSIDTTSTLTSLSGSVFNLVFTIITAFIGLGVVWSILQVYRKQKDQVAFKDALRAFSDVCFGKSFATLFMKGLFLMLWLLVGMIPLFFCTTIFTYMMFAHLSGQTQTNLPILIIFFVIVTILCLIPFFIKLFSYAMTDYILYDALENGTYTSAKDYITKSRQMMDGYKRKLFWLEFSFIGWWILVGFTLGLASIYVVPYAMTSRTIFYEQLKATLSNQE